jgi:hypothetical protein
MLDTEICMLVITRNVIPLDLAVLHAKIESDHHIVISQAEF